MKEIRLQDIAGFQIGSAENEQAGTGCTVIICPQGAPCGQMMTVQPVPACSFSALPI